MSWTSLVIEESLSYCLAGLRFSQHAYLTFISRTPDRDFCCFYTCERILSNTFVPALGKDKKKRTAARRPHAGRTSIRDAILMYK